MKNDIKQEAYVLKWDLDHLGDDEFDARLMEFSGWKNVGALASTKDYTLPENIYFEANFRTLKKISYPYNSIRWPIMSKKMLKILLSVGTFPHRTIPITMINDTVMTLDRYDQKGNYKTEVLNNNYVAIQLLESLDVIDFNKSKVERDEDYPQYIDFIEKLVLKVLPEGLPPLFRIQNYFVPLFISGEAREAVEAANLQEGIKFIPLDEYRG